jgi:hypothetical protein
MSSSSTTSDYVFRLKKGDLELEVQSNDATFMENQMANWRNILVQSATGTSTPSGGL